MSTPPDSSRLSVTSSPPGKFSKNFLITTISSPPEESSSSSSSTKISLLLSQTDQSPEVSKLLREYFDLLEEEKRFNGVARSIKVKLRYLPEAYGFGPH